MFLWPDILMFLHWAYSRKLNITSGGINNNSVDQFLSAMHFFKHPIYSRMTEYLNNCQDILSQLATLNLTDFMLEVSCTTLINSFSEPMRHVFVCHKEVSSLIPKLNQCLRFMIKMHFLGTAKRPISRSCIFVRWFDYKWIYIRISVTKHNEMNL